MPNSLLLYPAAPAYPMSVITDEPTPVGQMHAASTTFQLDPAADPTAIHEALMSAVAGQSVTVPIVYVDRLGTVYLQVQPQLWGAWAIIGTDDPDA